MFVRVKDFKDIKFSSNLLFLYVHRVLMQIGSGLISVFAPLYFYNLFNKSVNSVLLIYIISYFLYGMLVPFGAMLIHKIGLKRMMIVGMPSLMLAYGSLVYFTKSPLTMMAFFIIFLLIFRLLYWVPYHIDFAKFTDKQNRGKQMSILLSVSTLILSATPLIGGVVLLKSSFESLFMITLTLYGLSIAPIFFIQDVKEKYTFGYLETFKKLFSKKQRPILLAYSADGMQNSIQIVIWPIFVYFLLNGEYLKIGLISSLTVLMLVFARFITGDLADKWDKKKLHRLTAVLYTTGWVFKIFVKTGFEIFLSDTYHKVGRVMNRMSMDTTLYTEATENEHYIDEYTVLREIANNLGKAVVLTLSILIIAMFNITTVFILAALATLATTMLNAPHERME